MAGEGGGERRKGGGGELKAAQSASYPAAGEHRSRTRRLNTVDFFLYTQKHENANRYAAETRSSKSTGMAGIKELLMLFVKGKIRRKKEEEKVRTIATDKSATFPRRHFRTC